MRKLPTPFILPSFILLGSFFLFQFASYNKNLIRDWSLDNIPMCSGYAPAFKFHDLPPAILMDGIGNSHLQVTTRNEMAQKFFDQGINHLHSFWDVEAYRAFREAIKHDPNCAMAYWGLYKSITQTAKEMQEEKTAALKKAIELSVNASDRERRFIKATQLQVEKGKDAFMEEMDALIDAYPDEVEAKLFLATALSTSVSTYDPEGRPKPGKVYGQMILQELLHTHPNLAAAHHYWIHAVENGPNPERALESADKIASMAPNSGHMTHMPGHIYYRIGKYDKAYDAFIYSMTVDSLYMTSQAMNPINNWNFTHNVDYLVASCAENGQYQEAMKWARQLSELPVDKGRLMAGGLAYILFGAHTAVPRLQMRFQEWAAAAKSIEMQLKKDPTLSSLAMDYYKGMMFYALGMNAIIENNALEAGTQLEKLNIILQKLEAIKQVELGADWYFSYARKILQVNYKELEGSISSIKGDHEKAIQLLKEAANDEKNIGYWEPPHYTRPVLETLGQAYIRAGNLDAAIDAFNGALKLRPKNGHSKYAMAQAYKALGNKAQAKQAFNDFLITWPNADKDLKMMAIAHKHVSN
ncbi:MAG: tetratricopeptide repeat protein [Saprospiraceae bacterium]|nr:tetratricopeptide repeat protein [Saprospiraceae bacterium]